MEIKIEKLSNRFVAHCIGRLDTEAGPELENSIVPLIAENELPVVIDLSGVSFISSAGIRSLIFLMKSSLKKVSNSAFARHNTVRLINAKGDVKKILQLANIDAAISRIKPITSDKRSFNRSYGELIESVREMFPSPVSEKNRDDYFVTKVSKSLNMLDGMKSEKPYLGNRQPLDFDKAKHKRIPDKMGTLDECIENLSKYMHGIIIWGHPHTQENVVPPSSIPSIIGHIFASVYNPNIISDEYSYGLSLAEIETAAMMSELGGYDSNLSTGFSTFGGTGTIFYGIKIGLEKACPGTFHGGLKESPVVVASHASHYAKLSALAWTGIGLDNFVAVPSDGDNSMDLLEYERTLRGLIEQGRKIACIIATMGTTDAFGIDNIEYIAKMRDKLVEEYQLPYKPHIHADAVIGWAWLFFKDYDFEANPMGFSQRTLRSLWDTVVNISSINHADSFGVDFHKSGYGPYVSSMVLIKNREDLNLITRDAASMPYLFQFGNYHPGVFTMETSRSGGSVLTAVANLLTLGVEGYRTIIGHIVAMAEILREKVESSHNACLVNNYNYGPVTLFRVYPEGVNAAMEYREEISNPEYEEKLRKYNDYNRRVFAKLQEYMEEGRGFALSLTERARDTVYGKPVLALKSFVMSPFVDEQTMSELISIIDEAVNETTF